MIRSILDNDLYKFTMQQAVCRLYSGALAEYELTNRGGTPFPGGFVREVRERVDAMAGLALSPGQKCWLAEICPFFTPDYLDFLSAYRFDPAEVSLAQEDERISVTVKGTWARTILWEVPLMALISETYFDMTAPEIHSRQEIRETNRSKARRLADQGVSFVDFGTRRRFSSANHRHLVSDILDLPGHTLAGTSNVHLAQEFNIPPIGTLAHEWIMFHSALDGYAAANASAMRAWLSVYPDVLGIALSDTYTTAAFLDVFTPDLARRFTGVRQDSGDPCAFVETFIRYYRDAGIDPADKTIVFSDGLDPERAVLIHRFCRGRVKDAYGIGTNLTNDVGTLPLNIVIKLSRCRPGKDRGWQSTVKLSDDPGKHTGDKAELKRCTAAFGIKGKN